MAACNAMALSVRVDTVPPLLGTGRMTPIETLQQRQVVVAALRGEHVAASQQLTHLAMDGDG
jgi:hypothetical protein